MAIDLIFKECAANLKARRTRKALAKLYERDPRKAIEHANAAFDEANRIEANRAELERMPVTV